MMSMRCFSLVLTAGVLSTGLGACTTPHLKPTPSQAVADARAHRNAAAVTCAPLSSPLAVDFGFGEAQVTETVTPALDDAGKLLTCHPQASAIVVGQADGHGTAEDQKTLANARVQAVVAELQRRGVATSRVQTQAEGAAPAGDDSRLVILAEGRRW